MGISVTIGNIVFLIMQFYILFRKEGARKKFLSLFMFTVFCEIFYNLGYLFEIGDYEINLPYISIMITFIWGLLLSAKKIITIRGKYLLLFYIFLILGIVWRLASLSEIIGINHYVSVDSLATGSSMVKLEVSGYSFLVLARTILCSFSLSCFASCFNRDDFARIIRKYLPIFRFMIIFAVIEFFSNNFVDSNLIRTYVIKIFGACSTAYLTPSFRGMLYSICLTCWEPSLANYALFFCSLAILWNMNYSKKKVDKIYILVANLMMLLSMSLTGVIFVIAILALMLFRKNVRDKAVKVMFIAIPTAVIAVTAILISSSGIQDYIVNRLVITVQSIQYMIKNPQSTSIFGVFGGASETIRFYSMFNNLYVWTKSPIIGIGIGTASCCSGWISALANVGIVGIYLLLKIYKSVGKKLSLTDYRSAALLIGALFTIQGGLTDIFCNTFYIVLIIFASGIISNYRVTETKTKTAPVKIKTAIGTN